MIPTTPKKTFRSDIPVKREADAAPSVGGYPSHAHEESRRLVVGPGIHLQGNVSSCAHLVVEGRIDATLLTAQRMDVLLGGQFSGVAEVQEAVISGRVDGTLTVHGRVLLRPGARVSGELRYGSLQIEAGAQLQGSLTPISALADLKRAEPAVAPAAVDVSPVEILFAEPPRVVAAPSAADDEDIVAKREAPGSFRRYR